MDNYYKSGDGFFTTIPVRTDSVEEVTLSTSAAGAESSAQGAAQVKFITRGGTNEFHGGTFWQHRNTALDANYYFNNIDGLPRDRVILNQGGVHVGGPIKKNKLFFFTNFEVYRYPATSSATRTVLTPTALNGDFRYVDSNKKLQTVNLYALAAANGYVSTPDPIIVPTLQKINSLTSNGILRSREASSSDYNRNDLIFQPGGMSKNNYDTTRLDYNITEKHHLQFVWTYIVTDSTPDITNSVVPIYPGTGTVLGYDNLVAGQRGNRYSGAVALRSTLSSTVTNELRTGMNRSLTLFRDQISSPSLFSQWRGYSPTLTYITGVASVSGSSRRTSPVKELHDTLSWVKGRHLLSFGGDFSQIGFWYNAVGTSMIPTISLGSVQSTDPINSIFNATNFPNSTSTDWSNAKALYAILTGRVYSITRSVVLDENTHKYANVPQVDRNRQREWGTFIQDTWRVAPSLTLSLGVRFEQQRPFVNTNQIYSGVSYDSVWGISGVGNMFKPGTLQGVSPTITALDKTYQTPNSWSPSIGLAWQMPGFSGPLGALLGKERGKSVLRAGYGIASIREGTYVFQNMYGSNPGVTQSASVDPANYPQYFGAAGSVLFRDATLPVRPTATSPAYPITPAVTDSLNTFDPNLKMSYVQSWNVNFSRELARNMALEVRYTGNHGLKEWRQVNLNEINIYENGFLNEFTIAQNNLAIARQTNANSTNFGNQGLAGQQNIPILQTALGSSCCTDSTTATSILQNRPGSVASSISSNTTRMANLTKAGYPANFFVVNPGVAGGGAYVLTNLGSSFYNALQVELRRRMSAGLLFQFSYVWSHSITNGPTSSLSDYSNPTTFRNLGLDRRPGEMDIRHAFKYNAIYELPIGPGKKFLSFRGAAGKILEGWQLAGISRVQSGLPFQLTSNRQGMNTSEAGVVLYNMTASELQDMVKIRKVTTADGQGLVYYLPQSIIDNTNAAFEVNGKTLANLDKSKPYIGPQMASGQFGNRVFLYNPWQYHLDLSLLKVTKIKERANVEFRAQALDALNMTSFFLANTAYTANFGQTRTAFRDFSGTADTGARILEFVLRVNF
jgi:TonB dependent receptor